MKYGLRDVIDLYVFDEDGKLVVKLNTLQGSSLKINDTNQYGEIFIKDALLDIDFLKFIQDNKNNKLSDFERLSKLYEVETITFNTKKMFKKCKLLAKTYFRNQNDGKDSMALYEIPNAKVLKNFQLTNENFGASVFDTLIQFEPYNEDGDLFKLHIQR